MSDGIRFAWNMRPEDITEDLIKDLEEKQEYLLLCCDGDVNELPSFKGADLHYRVSEPCYFGENDRESVENGILEYMDRKADDEPWEFLDVKGVR